MNQSGAELHLHDLARVQQPYSLSIGAVGRVPWNISVADSSELRPIYEVKMKSLTSKFSNSKRELFPFFPFSFQKNYPFSLWDSRHGWVSGSPLKYGRTYLCRQSSHIFSGKHRFVWCKSTCYRKFLHATHFLKSKVERLALCQKRPSDSLKSCSEDNSVGPHALATFQWTDFERLKSSKVKDRKASRGCLNWIFWKQITGAPSTKKS